VGEPQAFSLIRSMGAKTFQQLGWPQKKLENWRYSPVSRLQQDFIPQIEPGTHSALDLELIASQLSDHHFATIVVIDGKIQHWPAKLNGCVEVKTLREALEKGLIPSPDFSKVTDSIEALNLSFFELGFYLNIQDQVVIEKPIHWLQLYSVPPVKSLMQSRLYIHAGASSSAAVIESHVVLGMADVSWLNVTTQVKIESNAHLDFVQWNEINETQQLTQRTELLLKDAAYLHHLQGALSSGWHRNDVTVMAEGTNAEIYAHALGLSTKAGIIDQQSKLTFVGPNNKAEQVCKNLLVAQSRAIFNGRIHIQPGAQKTDSSQLHQSLLLSANAEVDTKPELEIYADDVKATHGATIGQLNADEVFYFQSRGISKERARGILCMAFLLDLCERIPNELLQRFLKQRIENYWRRESL
jgi:Fe-S cluster assembly protein SufD